MFKALTSGTQLPFPLFSYHFAGYKDVVEMLTTFWCKTYKDGEKRLERERERERDEAKQEQVESYLLCVLFLSKLFKGIELFMHMKNDKNFTTN